MNSNKKRVFDLVVIGSGPAGEGAAMHAAKEGLKVAVVEKKSKVGGSCTHLGTIPSKALRQVAHQIAAIQSDPLFSRYIDNRRVGFAELLSRARKVIEKQVSLRSGHYKRNDVEIIHGTARIKDVTTVIVEEKNGVFEELEAHHIVLATGSRPYQPVGMVHDAGRIFDSDSILNLPILPRTITVYGAGIVGCEYTSIFRSLGRKVNLVNTHPKLLSFLDDEISEALSYHLRDQGVLIRNDEQLEEVEIVEDQVICQFCSGKRVRSDILLYACGRTGNSENLGIESLGIEKNKRGFIKTNEHFQTSVPHIYAVGDLIGYPSLASSSYDQGRYAASHLINNQCDDALLKDYPIGIYTSPEISCIGKTEKELTEAKTPYEVGHASFRHLARAQIAEQTVGMLKILFHPQSLKILGIHCFGENASEIIHIGQAIMTQKGDANNLRYFVNTTFNYPTMAEAYRVAALNGLNRLP